MKKNRYKNRHQNSLMLKKTINQENSRLKENPLKYRMYGKALQLLSKKLKRN